jgi:hypothetical protein
MVPSGTGGDKKIQAGELPANGELVIYGYLNRWRSKNGKMTTLEMHKV